LLFDSWRLIRKDAAYGVDRVSAAEYEANLEENIHQLVERLKRKSYGGQTGAAAKHSEGRWWTTPARDTSHRRQAAAISGEATAGSNLRSRTFYRAVMGIGHEWELWKQWTN